jgi:hypothetical protein
MLSRTQGNIAAVRVISMNYSSDIITPPGIEPATLRLVALCPKQLRHHVPPNERANWHVTLKSWLHWQFSGMADSERRRVNAASTSRRPIHSVLLAAKFFCKQKLWIKMNHKFVLQLIFLWDKGKFCARLIKNRDVKAWGGKVVKFHAFFTRRSEVSFKPRPLRLLCPLHRWTDGPNSRSARFEDDKNSFASGRNHTTISRPSSSRSSHCPIGQALRFSRWSSKKYPCFCRVAVTCYRSPCLQSNLHKPCASLTRPVFSTACQDCELVLSEMDRQRQAGQAVSQNIEFTIWNCCTNVNKRTLWVSALLVQEPLATACRLSRPAGSTNRGECLRCCLAVRKATKASISNTSAADD